MPATSAAWAPPPMTVIATWLLAWSSVLISVGATVLTPSAKSHAPRPGPCSRDSFDVPNGGFESGKLAPWHLWSQNNANASIISAHDGPDGYAARLRTGRGTFASASFSPSINSTSICSATRYVLYYEYRAIGHVPACVASVSFNNLGGGYVNSPFIYFTNASEDQPFQAASLEFNNTDATEYELSVNLICEPTKPPRPHPPVMLDVDSFELAALGSIEPPNCPHHNMHVPNGNFELGRLGPWRLEDVSGNGTEVGVAYNANNPLGGKHNFRADFDLPSAHPHDIYGFLISVNISHVCVAYEYVVSFAYEWVQENEPMPAGHRTEFVVEIHNNGGTSIFPAKGWQTANFTFSARESGTNHLVVYLYTGAFDPITNKPMRLPSFALQLDDFKVQLATVPYPTKGS